MSATSILYVMHLSCQLCRLVPRRTLHTDSSRTRTMPIVVFVLSSRWSETPVHLHLFLLAHAQRPADSSALTAEKRTEYMKKGLWFNCGKSGHLSRDCGKKKEFAKLRLNLGPSCFKLHPDTTKKDVPERTLCPRSIHHRPDGRERKSNHKIKIVIYPNFD